MSFGTITLKQKDADWIANIMRENLKSLEESRAEYLEKYEDITRKAEKLAAKIEISEEDEREYQRMKADTLEKLNSTYAEERKVLERIIELMMVGSDE